MYPQLSYLAVKASAAQDEEMCEVRTFSIVNCYKCFQFLCLLHKAGPSKCSSNILGKLYSHWEWMWIVNTVYPSTPWKTMRMSQTWYAGVKNVACKCTTHNYNQVPNSIFTDQHHIQRCVTMIVIVSQLCHWWLTTPQLLVQQTPWIISPQNFSVTL